VTVMVFPGHATNCLGTTWPVASGRSPTRIGEMGHR